MLKVANKKPIPAERRIFAGHLRESRKTAGLTLKELEAQIGLSANYIATVERCVHNISLESMVKLSHTLEIPLYCLLNLQFKPGEWNDFWKAKGTQATQATLQLGINRAKAKKQVSQERQRALEKQIKVSLTLAPEKIQVQAEGRSLAR